MRGPGPAALLMAALVGTAGCGSVTKIAQDGGGGAGGAHGDSSTGTDTPRDLAADAPRDLVAGKDRPSVVDGPRDRSSVPPTDANSDGIVTGGECEGASDCKQYPAGVGGCCGACIPASDPQPPSVQCILPCLTPIKSCTCVNHQCLGSNTLL